MSKENLNLGDVEKSTDLLTKKKKIFDSLHSFIIILFIFHFIFNFLGLSFLKYHYILEVVLILFFLINRGWKESVILIFGLLVIEGQGRILWDYNPIVRVLFDSFLLIAFLRNSVLNKHISYRLNAKTSPSTRSKLMIADLFPLFSIMDKRHSNCTVIIA